MEAKRGIQISFFSNLQISGGILLTLHQLLFHCHQLSFMYWHFLLTFVLTEGRNALPEISITN